MKVFESDQFFRLIKQLSEASKAGKTAMWKGDFAIAADNRLGIDYGGKKVTILWTYCNPVESWTQRIAADEVQRDIREGQAHGTGRLPYSPNYSTGFENVSFWNWKTWEKLADLDAYQVTMLADLSHWNITTDETSANGPTNRDGICSVACFRSPSEVETSKPVHRAETARCTGLVWSGWHHFAAPGRKLRLASLPAVSVAMLWQVMQEPGA